MSLVSRYGPPRSGKAGGIPAPGPGSARPSAKPTPAHPARPPQRGPEPRAESSAIAADEDLPEANVSPPELGDPDQFIVRENVPLFDSHEDEVMGDVDEATLARILANTHDNISRKKYPQVTIGHTNENGVENHQPPLTGFLGGVRLGKYEDRKCILGDLYFMKDRYEEAMSYPHRSIERISSKRHPEQNRIWLVALTRRKPRRELGLLTYRLRPDDPASDIEVVRYAEDDTPANPAGESPEAIPPTQPYGGFSMPMTPEMKAELQEMVEEIISKMVEDAPEVAAEEEEIEESASPGEVAAEMDDEMPGEAEEEAETDEELEHYEAGGQFAQPGGGNTFVPTMPRKPGKRGVAPGPRPQAYRDTTANIQRYEENFRKVNNENARLKHRLDSLQNEHDLVMIKYEQDEINNLLRDAHDDHVEFDFDAESDRLKKMPRDQRTAHVDLMKKCYRRNNVGQSFIPTAAPNLTGNKGEIPANKRQAFIDFCVRKGYTGLDQVKAARAEFMAAGI